MEFKYLKIERKEDITFIEINRSEALNALNEDVLGELNDCFENLEKEKSNRVAVITGQGKAFVAGADIAKMRDFDPTKAYEFSNLGQSVFNKIDRSHIITIAAINGFALGGGMELALACDIRIASSKAKVGLPEVSLGLIPGFGGTQRLVRLVGTGIACEVVLTGNQYSAAEALQMGIVNKVTEPEELLSEATKMAKAILSRGTNAIQQAKRVIKLGIEDSMEGGLYQEKATFSSLFNTQEPKEGLSAFLEKRKPNF
ncbi:MAG: enoyl-CoA hydratase/isomerase family protein [Leptospiraceae bacterium]|nr:enoyl-CoA hydratase/isomerase family protein [Leptospiraceae bacterium]MCP5497702.1 enoyl-CoA hydratase/isomerase family protein [Leptospiraceae bacterium]